MRMTTRSSGWITIQALTSVAAAPPAAADASGKRNSSARPPPTRGGNLQELATRKCGRHDRSPQAVPRRGRGGIGGERVDRLSHPRVRAAAAQVGHRRVDVRVGRLRVLREERGGRHDHAGLAIAALRDLMLDPRFLDPVQALFRQALDGDDLLADRRRCGQRTGTHRLAVDVHRAGAAHGDAAAVLRSGKVEVVAQDPQQRHLGLDVDGTDPPIYGQLEHSRSSEGLAMRGQARRYLAAGDQTATCMSSIG